MILKKNISLKYSIIKALMNCSYVSYSHYILNFFEKTDRITNKNKPDEISDAVKLFSQIKMANKQLTKIIIGF